MKINIWTIIGLMAIGYGLFGIFYYFPSLEYIDKPFPFPHSTLITPNLDGNGFQAWEFADPLMAGKIDPYWIAWSVSLYFGIILFSITFYRFTKYQIISKRK